MKALEGHWVIDFSGRGRDVVKEKEYGGLQFVCFGRYGNIFGISSVYQRFRFHYDRLMLLLS